MENRFDRQIRLFGEAGQEAIRSTRVAVVGTGGTGSHVVQQLAYLGVSTFGLVDMDRADRTSGNRLIGASEADVENRRFKVEIAEDLISSINSSAHIDKLAQSVISEAAFDLIQGADFVFGCVDRDSVRVILNELCLAYERPYMDLATDVDPENPRNFGGRIVYSAGGQGCLHCWEELDSMSVDADFSSDARRRDDEAIYGVHRSALRATGPSVVSINGVIASLAVTEFMVGRTGIRPPSKRITYRGTWGKVFTDEEAPDTPCYYCKGIFSTAERSDVRRYIRDGWGERL